MLNFKQQMYNIFKSERSQLMNWFKSAMQSPAAAQSQY